MKLWNRAASLAVGSVIAAWSMPAFAQSLVHTRAVCPALTSGGRPAPLEKTETPSGLSELREVPPVELAVQAMQIIHRFEGGGANPYSNVSPNDGISVGAQQWNLGTGSIYEVFAMVDIADVQLAEEKLRADLEVLRVAAGSKKGSAERAKAAEIVGSWTTQIADDPLSNGVRKSLRRSLGAWLDTPPLHNIQNKLIAKQMSTAYAWAKAWRRDMSVARNTQPAAVDARLLTYFFDLVTYNGGPSGLWVSHVLDLRRRASTPALLLAEATTWVNSCAEVVDATRAVKHQKPYTLALTQRNLALWSGLPNDQLVTRLDEDAQDLIAFGLLRAQRSYGSNGELGFPGIWQVDVLYRRAIEAVGWGHLKDAGPNSAPSTLYAIH